jgi:hypothetical protein
MTTLTGSGLLALAVAASSRLRPHGGPRILMSERWGADAEAMARGPLARARGGGARMVAVATRSDTWTSRASLKPGLPRTAKKIWFSLSTTLGKSGVAEKTHKLKSGFFCVRILMILWSRASRRE